MKIKFVTIEDLYSFCNLATKTDGSINVISENGYVLDAKSAMGVMSLDLRNPIDVVCKDNVTEEDAKKFYQALTEMGIAYEN